MDAVAGRRLRLHGYETPSAGRPAPSDVARYVRTLAVKRAMVAKLHAGDRLRDARLRDDVAAHL
jgi:hypothetical protein